MKFSGKQKMFTKLTLAASLAGVFILPAPSFARVRCAITVYNPKTNQYEDTELTAEANREANPNNNPLSTYETTVDGIIYTLRVYQDRNAISDIIASDAWLQEGTNHNRPTRLAGVSLGSSQVLDGNARTSLYPPRGRISVSDSSVVCSKDNSTN